MTNLVIGNIISLIASLLIIYTGTLKDKKKIIFIETIKIILTIISNLILGSLTGAISNTIGCTRNILCYKNKLTTKYKIILMILSVSLSLYFNKLGFIGLLPIICSVTYMVFIDLKDVVKFKLMVIFTVVLWIIHDIYIQSYTSVIFYIINTIANIGSIIQIKRQMKLKNKKE